MKTINDELRHAAKTGNAVGLKALLARVRCNPMSTNADGYTALMEAASGGHVDCVKLLLPVSDALVTCNDGRTALIWAAKKGNFGCVELLVRRGEAWVQDKSGLTALMWAAFNGNTTSFQLLLPVSDALVQNKWGQTALMMVACNGSHAGVGLLLPVSEVLVRDHKGRTAGDYARLYGHEALAELMEAYALSRRERLVLSLETHPGATCKNTPMRV